MFAHLSLANLHHAYAVHGTGEILLPELHTFFKCEGIIVAQNPDVQHFSYTTFTVTDASDLKNFQILKSVGGGKKFFIVSFAAITEEAQHSLLKMLEEPVVNTHFFFITPSVPSLKSTVLSRMQVLVSEETKMSEEGSIKFLALDPKARLDYITKFIKTFDDDEDTGRERSASIELVQGVTKSLYEKQHELVVEKPKLFQELLQAVDYLYDRGSSPKMLLEHLALMLPVVK